MLSLLTAAQDGLIATAADLSPRLSSVDLDLPAARSHVRGPNDFYEYGCFYKSRDPNYYFGSFRAPDVCILPGWGPTVLVSLEYHTPYTYLELFWQNLGLQITSTCLGRLTEFPDMLRGLQFP